MCMGPDARNQGLCDGLLDLGQIPNKRDAEAAPASDLPFRSGKDQREFDERISHKIVREVGKGSVKEFAA